MVNKNKNVNIPAFINGMLIDRYIDAFNRGIELVKNSNNIRIIAHYDGDGVSAASIVVRLFQMKKKRFHLSFVKGVDSNFVNMLPTDGSTLLLLDIGSSAIDLIKNKHNTILMDHHPVVGDDDDLINLNPVNYGMDGTREACGTTISFLFTILYDEESWNSIPFFLAGTIADRQHTGGYNGLNKILVEEAVKRNLITVRVGLPYYGKPIAEEIRESTEPYLVGITGRDEGVSNLLNTLKIDDKSSYLDLYDNNSKLVEKLNSYIVQYLLNHGVRPEIAIDAVAPRYILKGDIENSLLLSSYMNACGREGAESLGVLYAMGDKSQISDLQNLQNNFHQKVIKELLKIESGNYTSLKSISYFSVEQPSIAGAVSGISVNYITDSRKPLFGYSVDGNGNVKVSSRGTRYMIEHGLNLTEVCKTAAEMVGGKGGGHVIASGANIKSEHLKKFMEIADKMVSEQLHF
ncbi:MAG: DHH family phosphoesterase [Candidatus Thermoplasmatota archaeon]|jgi:RecJ-like exonuclease|nr:DHH family phosphoesterase [Candidatus Thermoplasmatota archaeon]